MKRLIVTSLLAFAAATGWSAESGADWQRKVDPWVLDTAVSGQSTEFLVYLREQADLHDAAQQHSKLARGRLVFERLTDVASRAQAPVIAALRAAGVEYRPYWVVNMIWVRGDASVVRAMAERADVAAVHANPQVQMQFPMPGQGTNAPAAIEPNLIQVGAPAEFWDNGVTGEGVVVGGQDTGYDWDHPALKNHYRGWNGSSADHNYNWHDAIHSGGGVCGPDSAIPCDDTNHGTHTMGTMVGDDGGNNRIGMAPGAKWMGCRNMNQGVGTPTTYAECFQWFIAPTDLNGQNPDPAMAPDVINNSWGCPESEGCTNPNVLRGVVQNTRAAGIVVVVSAGNSGSSCSSVDTPAAIYDASFSVGSVNSADNISSFSSRGPVTLDGSLRLKPDVSAPGENIRSSVPGTGYAFFSGTSMAGPHVAGLVALTISAQACFEGDVDAIEQYVKAHVLPRTTTQSCGGVPGSGVPNNTYGYGALRAAFPVATECRAALGAAASGLASGTARCVNSTTGQSVNAPVDAALSFNCEAAGLLTSPGDQILLQLSGPAQADLVEGAITGLASRVMRCVNQTTHRDMTQQLAGRDSWRCAVPMSPGDIILHALKGTAD